MKLNKIIFPHPVLGLGRPEDFNGESNIADLDISEEGEFYRISFSVVHDNGTINDYVKNEKAVYGCEVQCPGTLYRNLILSKESKFNFEIKRTDLKKKVLFETFCFVQNQISNYRNPAAHDDYADFSFNLEKGDILAYFGKFDFDADLYYHKLKAASSFMEIVPNDGEELYTVYDIDNSKIRIKLPQELYDKFKMEVICKQPHFTEIIHASFVQVALTNALYRYKEKLSEGILWARSIENRLLNDQEINNGTDVFDSDQIPALVQKILGNPNQRLILRLENLSNFNDN